MELNFSKYHGAGNDFILIDNRKGNIYLSNKQIQTLCTRRFGIGADGLMILENDNSNDFRMKYYNCDGNESTMCGNGGRCIVAFAYDLGIIKEETIFSAIDGKHHAIINKKHKNGIYDISLEMNNVSEVKIINNTTFFLDTGSPHHVIFTKNIDNLNVDQEGRLIRNSELYKNIGGTNVNFIEIIDNELKIRTFERGVEGETHACGTGATAAAIAYALKENKFTE